MTDETTAPDPTAVLGRRVIAHLIDWFIYGAIGSAALFFLTESRPLPAGESLDRVGTLDDGTRYAFQGDTLYTLSDSDVATAAAAAGIAVLLLAVVLQGLTGRTPGKFVTGIRTVRSNGKNPGLFKALVRQLLWIIDGIPSLLFPIVGFVIALITTGRRRLGDLVARTYVVKNKYAGSPIIHPDDDDGDVVVGVADSDTDTKTTDESFDWTEDDQTDTPVVDGGVTDDRAVSESAWADDEATDQADEAEPDTGDTVDAAEPDAEPESEAADEGGSIPDQPADASTTEPTEPTWDPDRKAYISYDPRRGGWMQHDTETGEWGPISRA